MPVVSGEPQKPFFCETEANGLGRAVDSDCSANTVVGSLDFGASWIFET
jgi:hypothetical protein